MTEERRKPRITVLGESFPPAKAAGGPIRSIGSLVRMLGSDFDFRVMASASGLNSVETLDGVTPDRWTSYHESRVYYVGKTIKSRIGAVRELLGMRHDVLYLNSVFNVRYSIIPFALYALCSRSTPVLVAPRGEFSSGALRIRARKKRIFLKVCGLLGYGRRAHFHASSESEAEDIRRVIGRGASVHVARNLRDDITLSEVERPAAEPTRLSIVYLSRIVPKKNLTTLIEAIGEANLAIDLTVAGPIEDSGYWQDCRDRISKLPSTVRVGLAGPIAPENVVEFMSRFDVFVFPTLGENFGHVVLESLAAGTPVIVGRDTPWAEIESSGAGWTCDPLDVRALADQIREFDGLSVQERRRMGERARLLARSLLADPTAIESNRKMFGALVDFCN